MERPNYRDGVIIGAHRRALVDELLGVREPIVLRAPAGYGKSVLADLLRTRGIAVPIVEKRTYSMRVPRASRTIIGPRELAFGDDEIAEIFRTFSPAPQTTARIHELTRGWPAGVLYFARLARLGTLESALSNLADNAFDDLYDYIEENFIAPASRSQRLAFIFDDRGEFAPIVCAAMRLRRSGEFESACAHRAKRAAASLERGAPIDLESLSRLPPESLVSHPNLWLAVSGARSQPSAAGKIEPALFIELFRGRVTADGSDVPLVRRELAVLFTLAATPDGAVDSQHLAAAIWPELDGEHRRTALKVAVSRLRARLGDAGFVRYADGKYRLAQSVRVDAALLANALDGTPQALPSFEPVLSASRAPRLRDAEWFAPIESKLSELAHRLAKRLAENAIASGDARTLRRIGHALLAADSCDETGCELVIRGHLLDGRPDEARREYDRFAEHLRDELGCAPSVSFQALAGAS